MTLHNLIIARSQALFLLLIHCDLSSISTLFIITLLFQGSSWSLVLRAQLHFRSWHLKKKKKRLNISWNAVPKAYVSLVLSLEDFLGSPQLSFHFSFPMVSQREYVSKTPLSGVIMIRSYFSSKSGSWHYWTCVRMFWKYTIIQCLCFLCFLGFKGCQIQLLLDSR